jgi:Family of unknown function (DUF6114)/zinc-ribbon domain
VNRYDRMVAGVAIASDSVAIFVVGLYSPFLPFWLASGLVILFLALTFGGIVVVPWATKRRSSIPDPFVQYLFVLVLTVGIVIMLVAAVILGIGLFIWLRFGEYDRVAFALREGAPFLVFTIVLSVASFGLLRGRLWAWWQALVGSGGAIAHGIYRYSLSRAFVPGTTNQFPWLSSNPGAWMTMVLGSIVLVQLMLGFRPFRLHAMAVPSPARGQIPNYPGSYSTGGSNMAEKPTAAFVLSLLGGIFILLGGAVIAAIGASMFVVLPAIGLVIGVIGLAFGVLVLVGAIMLYVHPEQHVTWGVIILVFSILSVFTSLGGFLVGLILGIIGGALGIGWKPRAVGFPGYVAGYPSGYGAYGPPPTPIAPPGYVAAPGPNVPAAPSTSPEAPAFCRNCGAPLAQGIQFCPSCGMKVAG